MWPAVAGFIVLCYTGTIPLFGSGRDKEGGAVAAGETFSSPFPMQNEAGRIIGAAPRHMESSSCTARCITESGVGEGRLFLMQTCLACHQSVTDANNYCSHCGQSLVGTTFSTGSNAYGYNAEALWYRAGKFVSTHKFWTAFCAGSVWLLLFIIFWDYRSTVATGFSVGVEAAVVATLTLLATFIVLGFFYLLATAAFSWAPFKPGKDKPAEVPISAKQDDLFSDTIYPIGVIITGLITFVVTWIYCIATYGFLLGVGLGWLPAIIVAYIVGYLWPLILIGIIGIILLLLFNK